MRKILSSNKEFQRKELSRAEAKAMFADQPYKLELIDGLPEDATISIYNQGDFTDLCRGPHVCSTKEINAQSLKRGSGKDWGRMFRVVERREPIQNVDGLGLWDVKDVSLRRFLSGTYG